MVIGCTAWVQSRGVHVLADIAAHRPNSCCVRCVLQLRSLCACITALCSLVSLLGACGVDGGGSAAPAKDSGPSDGSAMTAGDASRHPIADTGGPPPAEASSLAD